MKLAHGGNSGNNLSRMTSATMTAFDYSSRLELAPALAIDSDRRDSYVFLRIGSIQSPMYY
eukprot:111517-Amphidinium_carterae.1